MNQWCATCVDPSGQPAGPTREPEAELLDLLSEWRRLTDCETRAIRLADWNDITAQQARKEQLQRAITAVLRRNAPQSPDRDHGLTARSTKVRQAVAELLDLEAGNRDLIAAQLEIQRVEQDRVNSTTRDLRSMRRAYGKTHASHWQSYS